MKISYDSQVDALSISFRDTTVTTRELAEGIAGEHDSEGRLAGIEFSIPRHGSTTLLLFDR